MLGMATTLPTRGGRRFHRKSRYGCTPCKRRRIKCDEKKPICSNCSHRSLDCTFQYLEPIKTQAKPSTVAIRNPLNVRVTATIPTQLPGPVNFMSFCRSNTRDLELYCHFQTYTAPTFTYPVPVHSLFREDIPGLSITAPFVGHGILSLAYIHLASVSPQRTSAKLLTEAAFHINKALPGYSSTLEKITAQNSSALFTFAIFVVLFTFASADDEANNLLRGVRDPGQPHGKELEVALAKNVARVIRSVQNIFGIFWRCQQWISSSVLAPVIRRYIPPTLNEDRMHWVWLEDGHLAKVGQLWQGDPTLAPSSAQALSDSLQYLRETFAMVTQLTIVSDKNPGANKTVIGLVEIHEQLTMGKLDDTPSVFTWYIRLSPDFISLVEEGNAYAMVIIAHFAIVLERACVDKWWTHSLPSHFLATAALILGEQRRAWIDWPLSVLRDSAREL